jgi:hypothetical protein
MLEIRELIDRFDGNPAEVTTAVTLQVMTDKRLRSVVQEIVMGHVRREVTAHRREQSRMAEDRAFRDGDPFENMRIEDMPLANPLAARRELLKTSFFDPSSATYVEWGKATAAQHLARAEYMSRFARTVIEDAERHRMAAKEISDHKVANLNELERKLAVA